MPVNTAPSFGVGDGKVTTGILPYEYHEPYSPYTEQRLSGEGRSVMVQGDGKILVAGYGDENGSAVYRFALLRYNSDGSLDTSFDTDGIVTTAIGASSRGYSGALQADGKILMAGNIRNGAFYDFALARYNSDGSLDTSFDTDGILTTDFGVYDDVGYSLAVQADGKIVVAGYSYNGTNHDFALARYNSDGSLDTTFDGDGKLTTAIGAGNDLGNSVTVQADGKILVAGESNNGTDNDFALVRYNSDGSLDTSFSGDGKLTTAIGAYHDSGRSITVQADGKILVGGYSNSGNTDYYGINNDFALVRYNANGSLDTSFSGDGMLTTDFGGGRTGDSVNSVIVQADGKILVVGSAGGISQGWTTSWGGCSSVGLVRYNSDGSLDTSFGTGGMVTTGTNTFTNGYSVTVQDDGKIVVAGNGSNTYSSIALMRFNADGSLDSRFDPVTTLEGTVGYTENGTGVVLDPDVQIYDAELVASGNYSGASLTLRRHGGANGQDIFSSIGNLGVLTQGSDFTVGGTVIGTVSTNSAGTLTLTFNANATQELVNSTMRQIAYSNSSDAPPASVRIDWSFNDGNISGHQGTGGAGVVTGSTTVAITGVNDAPSRTSPAAVLAAGTEDTAYTVSAAQLLTGWSDIEGNSLSVTGVTANHGTVVNNGNGTYTVTSTANYNGAMQLSYSVGDGVVSTATTLNYIVNPVNDAPTAPHANTIPGQLADTGQVFSYTFANGLFTDIDGDTLSYSARLQGGAALPAGLSFNGASRTFSGSNITPGDYIIQVTASDGVASSATTFLLTIKDVVVGSGGVFTGTGASELIVGTAGADTMAGGGGNDTYIVDNAGDTITEAAGGGSGDDVRASVSCTLTDNVENLTLTGTGNLNGIGNSGINTLRGNSGNNILDGGGGIDIYAGGAGNDTYIINTVGETAITEYANEGSDLVNVNVATANGSYTLAANVENATLTNTVAYTLIGNELNNVLRGNAANNVLNGGVGVDTLAGGAGNDTYVISDLNDVITELTGQGTDLIQSSVTYSLVDTDGAGANGGNVENLRLTGSGNINGTGNALNNVLTGNAGDNVLNGGLGNDTTAGGRGNDTYVINVLTDVVTELAGQGTDLIRSSISYSLVDTDGAGSNGGNVENLQLMGTGNINGSGNGQSNVLFAGAGNNILDGSTGIDTASYLYAGSAVTVSLAVTAAQTTGGSGSDTLRNIENLTGSVYADSLTGNAGSNVLDGGLGNDTLAGGLGSDTYVINVLTDVVTELVGQGTDLIQSSITYSLEDTDGAGSNGGNVENLQLTGTRNINGTGNSLNNVLSGNAGNNILSGGAGNDTLDGGLGNDTMIGGLGNDTYVISALTDIVSELTGQGVDLIQSSITYSLVDTDGASANGGNVENLQLMGTSNINGSGNARNNTIYANNGVNIIDGGVGNDTLSYLYATSSGSDGVTLNLSVVNGSGQSMAGGISGTDLVKDIENISGSNYNDILTGNAASNILNGGAGNDTLGGGAGADVIWGGLGNDSLTGGAGGDNFVFNTALNATSNMDRIIDFSVTDDTIQLENAIFTSLSTTGVLAAGSFRTGSGAVYAENYILYNSGTGALSYDADGSGATAAVQFATLATGLSLTSADFVIV